MSVTRNSGFLLVTLLFTWVVCRAELADFVENAEVAKEVSNEIGKFDMSFRRKILYFFLLSCVSFFHPLSFSRQRGKFFNLLYFCSNVVRCPPKCNAFRRKCSIFFFLHFYLFIWIPFGAYCFISFTIVT